MTKLTVDWQEVFWLHHRHDHLQLFFVSMTRDVNVNGLTIDNMSALFVEVIDDIEYRGFVTGNNRGRDNNRIATLNLDVAMFARSDAR